MNWIKPDVIALLHAASRPFSFTNGSRVVMHVVALPVARWFDDKVPQWSVDRSDSDSLVLQGVPFGLIALLALDILCVTEYSTLSRDWEFIFRGSKCCADALEVKFKKHANDDGIPVGIRMTYSHGTPGELKVAIISALPDRCASARM
jgi:hypothetical protein